MIRSPMGLKHMNTHMNPYVVGLDTSFDWQRLDLDMQDKILGHAGRRVVEERASEQPLPDELRPPSMPGDPWPETLQTYSFERSRDSIFGPLTVTFSECVNRSWWGFAREAGNRGVGWPLDKDAVCAAMDFKQTWSGVSKIRLRRLSARVPQS